jgi:protease-4
MDSQPTPPVDPVRQQLAAEAARGPIRVIIQQPPASWLGRIFRWGFTLLVALFVLGSLVNFYHEDDKLAEHWHSLSTTATDRIAIISIEGAIIGEQEFFKQQIDHIRDSEHIRAVVLRVDSPGGTVTGSDYIYHHLKKLVEDKQIPLVVSMGGIAASGGYYVAMAAGDTENTIYAEPTTWTGSIGVIIPHYDISGLLEKYNVQDDSIASNPLKMMGSPTRKFPEAIRAEEQAILKELVDSSFAGFKEIVLDARPALRMNEATQNVVFTGRIFTAKQALENQLVDRLGFVEDAIDRAIELASLDKNEVRVIKFKRPHGFMEQLLIGSESRKQSIDLTALLDLTAPRAYYMCTWTPGLSAAPRE